MIRPAARWAAVLAVPVIAAWHGAFVFLGGYLLVLAAVSAYSMAFMPWVPCWRCRGSGTRSHGAVLGWLFPRAFGACWRCKGDKGWVRLAVRVLQPRRAERISLRHDSPGGRW